ncbi:MAG TPA: hypothetical protein VJ841_03785 [Candidatus Saccharimonadales bacterium]|nr:hypothetical protein [Candidatus Saccharimonadales bacterium]
MSVPAYTLPNGDLEEQCAVLYHMFLRVLGEATGHSPESVEPLSELFGSFGCLVRSGEELFSLTIAKQSRNVTITQSERNGKNSKSVNVKALLEERVIRDF